MEIHLPNRPILTFKEALVHLSIITTGILIALSLEGALQWLHHRELVLETRERIHSEMRGNQRSIQDVLESVGPAKTRFTAAIDALSDLSSSEKQRQAASTFAPGAGNLLSGISFAFFNTASYTTAENTGAFGLMDYAEAIKYADAYDLQTVYTRLQDNAEKDAFAAAMLGTALMSKPTSAELEDVKRQVRLALGGLIITENVAKKLNELYTRALSDEPSNGH
jgi:hypothetical protein